MRLLVLGSYAQSLINFRGDLMKEMVKAGHQVIAVAPENDYSKEIEALGVKFLQVEFNRTEVNIFNDLKFLRKLIKVFKKEKPDVFFGYTIKPVVYGVIASRLTRVKKKYAMITGLGSTFIGTTYKNIFLKEISKTLYKYSLTFCNKVIFHNLDDMNEFVNMKLIKKNKCFLVNGSGVNLTRFRKSPLPEKPNFLLIARLLISKGVMEYLKAAEQVKKAFPDVIFDLVGPFDSNPTCLQYKDVKYYIDNKIVEYHGVAEDVRPYLKKCSIYVLPSYREGTPRTVLEAMAFGRPVITSDTPGCRETVIDGKTGFLIPVKSVKALKEKMIWMVEHPVERNVMGEEGYKYCKEKFDVITVNKEMMKILELEQKM